MLDFREIKYVLAVADTQSFSKAAELLYISQPSLSQYIQGIEKNIGLQLFDRRKKPISLTRAGFEYVKTARLMLHNQKELMRKLEDMSNLKVGQLSIGIVSQRGVYFLPKVIPLFKEKYPGIEIKLFERNSGYELEDALVRGKVDLIIVSLPLYNSNIYYETITEEKLYLAIPPEYDIDRFTRIDKNKKRGILLENFSKEQFILMPNKMKLRKLANTLCSSAGFIPNIILETYNIYTAQHMVAEGLGVTFLYETLIFHDNYKKRPIYIPFQEKTLSVPLVLASSRYELSNATQAFISLVKEIYSNPSFVGNRSVVYTNWTSFGKDQEV